MRLLLEVYYKRLVCVFAYTVTFYSHLFVMADSFFGKSKHSQPISSLKIEMTNAGKIECFPGYVQQPYDPLITCETSGITFLNNQLILATDNNSPKLYVDYYLKDKIEMVTLPAEGDTQDFEMLLLPLKVFKSDVRAYSKVFTLPYDADTQTISKLPIHYFKHNLFQRSQKFEEITMSPDKRFTFAITGFDRIHHEGKLDHFNVVLYWPTENPEQVKVLHPTFRNGNHASLHVRHSLLSKLGESQYFKIEGMAVIPEGKILFGVRELGKDFDDFDYTFKIVVASYKEIKTNDGAYDIELEDDFHLIYDLSPKELGDLQALGLSSLQWDPYRKQLLILTAFEDLTKISTSEQIGSVGTYLWTLSLDDLVYKRPPKLVYNEQGKPFRIYHKAEDLTLIDENTLLLICDDDRVTFFPEGEELPEHFHIPYRTLNEAVYYVLKIR